MPSTASSNEVTPLNQSILFTTASAKASSVPESNERCKLAAQMPVHLECAKLSRLSPTLSPMVIA